MVYQHMALARQPSYSTLIQSLCISTSENQTQSCSTSSTIFETSLSEIQLPFSEFPVSLTLNFMLRACPLLWIPKSRLLWATDCEHFHLAIPKQYHQRWIFFLPFCHFVHARSDRRYSFLQSNQNSLYTTPSLPTA